MKTMSTIAAKIRDMDGKFKTIPALRGATAYEIAVRNGFTGTEEEWASKMLDDGWVTKCQELENNKADKTDVYTKSEIYTMVGEMNSNKLVIEKVQSSMTWIAPKAYEQKFKVFCVGGGGGGGIGLVDSYNTGSGGGGGGGGYIQISELIIPYATEIDIVCGSGGAKGSDGGSTMFGDLLSANGGKSGGSVTRNTAGNGGVGGSGGGGGGMYRYVAADPLSIEQDGLTPGNGGDGIYGAGGSGGGGIYYTETYYDKYFNNAIGGTSELTGDGGSASNPGDTSDIPASHISIADALFYPDKLKSIHSRRNTKPFNGNAGDGCDGGVCTGKVTPYDNKVITTAGGGGGGYFGDGGSCDNHGGGGGGGYFGNGGTGNSAGGGGGGFLSNGGNGGYWSTSSGYTGDGGGGGGFFSDGSSGTDGGTGGNGGVLIMYIKED